MKMFGELRLVRVLSDELTLCWQPDCTSTPSTSRTFDSM
jgi:hypothetical protein